jgi:hypothetical protein
MCPWVQVHIYIYRFCSCLMSSTVLPCNAICIECYGSEGPINSSSHFASWVLIQFLWWSLFWLLLTWPHWAVMIGWNISSTLNMSFRAGLFTLGAWTDRLVSVVPPGWESRPVQPRVDEAAAVGVCCCVAPLQRIVLGWCGWKRTPFSLQSWALSVAFSFASLPWCGCGLDSWRAELQHVGTDAALPFSRHSLCRRLPPHHIQQNVACS